MRDILAELRAVTRSFRRSVAVLAAAPAAAVAAVALVTLTASERRIDCPGAVARDAGASATRASTAGAPAASAPAAEAIVRRDAYGVPHILAATERDAAVAHGYCVAEDHLETLARLFLRAQGRLAEKFGEQFVRDDLFMHRLGIHDTAARRFRELPPHVQAIFEGFAEGYNLYLAGHAASVPAWAEPVTGIDVLAHVRAVSIVDFSPDLRAWQDAPDAAGPRGSAMWLVGRSKSRSGRGLMLATPHLVWEGSRLFHEVHLRVPGYLDVAGVAPIGVPAVVIGFNAHIGWALTVNQIDADDVYDLTLPAECPDGYLYDRACVPLEKRVVTIAVKDTAKDTAKGTNGLTERKEVVYRSHHGPLISRDGHKARAWRSASLDQIDFVTQLNAMAKAASLGAFQAALDLQALPLFNVGYTDRQGHLFYLFDGRIPYRPDDYRGRETLPGDTSRADWRGMIPIARLPQLLNPAAGYIQNANDPPWLTVLEQPIDPRGFEQVTAARGLSLRGQQALRVIHAKRTYELADLLAMKNETRWPLADRLKDDLIALARNESTAAPAAALETLARWDNRASEDSRGSVLFWRWWTLYQQRAKPIFRTPWSDKAPLKTPHGIGDRAAAVQAFREALAGVSAGMTAAPGATAPAWGDLYRFRRGDLDLPVAGASGQTGTLRVLYFKPDEDGRFSAVAGESYALGVELQDAPVAFSVLPYSQSSRPASPHYNDQARLFVAGQYKRLWFSERDIEAHTTRTYRVPEAPGGERADGSFGNTRINLHFSSTTRSARSSSLHSTH